MEKSEIRFCWKALDDFDYFEGEIYKIEIWNTLEEDELILYVEIAENEENFFYAGFYHPAT